LRRLILTGAILMIGCTGDFETAVINGNLYLIARKPWLQAEGLQKFDKHPKGKYAGMLFVFPSYGEREFHTEGFRHYLMLCNFEGGVKRNCLCLPPNTKVRVSGRIFLEELYEEECSKKVFF